MVIDFFVIDYWFIMYKGGYCRK